MKKRFLSYVISLGLLVGVLSACVIDVPEQTTSVSPALISTPSPSPIPTPADIDLNMPSHEILHLKQEYIKAYTDFLLNADIDDPDFPIWGFLLLDLNFDGIPELGIRYDSRGSMGGYWIYYCFDGKKVVPVGRWSIYTQVLADYENDKMYLLKEMYLLRGNENGTYGYLREVINQNGIPCVFNILSLEVNQHNGVEEHFGKHRSGEDGYLSDFELDDHLITQFYSQGEWIDISSYEYLKVKRELIPEDNSFVDLRNTDAYIELPYDVRQYDDIPIINRPATKEEIDILFSKWRYTQ